LIIPFHFYFYLLMVSTYPSKLINRKSNSFTAIDRIKSEKSLAGVALKNSVIEKNWMASCLLRKAKPPHTG